MRIIAKNFFVSTLVMGSSAAFAAPALIAQPLPSGIKAVKLAAPIPLPVGQLMRFPALTDLWTKAQPATEQFLLGNWKSVAFATNAACADKGKDRYDENGVKNDDGSIEAVLSFSNVKIPAGGLGAGSGDQEKFAVTIDGLGSKDNRQGPYEVLNSEPQFSTNAYGTDHGTNKNYFEFSCRQIAGTTDQMVCLVNLVLDPPGDDACAKAPGIAIGYKRLTLPQP